MVDFLPAHLITYTLQNDHRPQARVELEPMAPSVSEISKRWPSVSCCLSCELKLVFVVFFFLMVENISKEEKYFGILENYTKCKLQSAQWFNCATAVLFYFLLACCLWLPVCSCNTGVAPNTEGPQSLKYLRNIDMQRLHTLDLFPFNMLQF